MANPWHQFKVGKPSTRANWVEDTCAPFSTVTHVCHVENALRILEDKRIRCSLVFDESTLNDRRILVNWLSPNTWANGYRYGNIAFTYDFDELIEGKNFYWVESIEKYSPPACRILITDLDRGKSLKVYDPSAVDGPWWHDKLTRLHYRNGRYTLEFMVEADLPLSAAKEITFVKHHSDYCALHRASPESCGQRGMGEDKGGALFLQAAASRGITLSKIFGLLFSSTPKPRADDLAWGLQAALMSIVPRNFDHIDFLGSTNGGSALGRALARAVLNGLVVKKRAESMELAAQFASTEEMHKAIAAVIAETFGKNDSALFLKAIRGDED